MFSPTVPCTAHGPFWMLPRCHALLLDPTFASQASPPELPAPPGPRTEGQQGSWFGVGQAVWDVVAVVRGHKAET